MELFFTLIDMFVAALCLYQAGKFGAAMQIDKIDGRKTETMFEVFYWLNLFFGLYLLISIYGRGIERGGM